MNSFSTVSAFSDLCRAKTNRISKLAVMRAIFIETN